MKMMFSERIPKPQIFDVSNGFLSMSGNTNSVVRQMGASVGLLRGVYWRNCAFILR